jgi:DNA-directed RNA polymerase subunit M/transcription elongation factor TFIIS
MEEGETEIGVAPDQADADGQQDNGPKSPKLRVQCPECGQKQKLSLPSGVTLDEAEGGDDDEAGMRTLQAACRSCEAEFEVAPPDGYQFSYVPNKFTKQGQGREAERTFFRSYEGRSDAADTASDALTCFRESYRNARNAARSSGWPSQ